MGSPRKAPWDASSDLQKSASVTYLLGFFPGTETRGATSVSLSLCRKVKTCFSGSPPPTPPVPLGPPRVPFGPPLSSPQTGWPFGLQGKCFDSARPTFVRCCPALLATRSLPLPPSEVQPDPLPACYRLVSVCVCVCRLVCLPATGLCVCVCARVPEKRVLPPGVRVHQQLGAARDEGEHHDHMQPGVRGQSPGHAGAHTRSRSHGRCHG